MPTQICVNELDIFKDLTLQSPCESTASDLLFQERSSYLMDLLQKVQGSEGGLSAQ